MEKNSLKALRPILIVFCAVTVFLLIGHKTLVGWGVKPGVLTAGNLLIFGVTLVAFLISYKALQSSNPNALVRAMYGSLIIKFFVIALGAFIYIMVAKKEVNKPAILASMGLYAVYTYLEVSALLKLLKQKKNA